MVKIYHLHNGFQHDFFSEEEARYYMLENNLKEMGRKESTIYVNPK